MKAFEILLLKIKNQKYFSFGGCNGDTLQNLHDRRKEGKNLSFSHLALWNP